VGAKGISKRAKGLVLVGVGLEGAVKRLKNPITRILDASAGYMTEGKGDFSGTQEFSTPSYAIEARSNSATSGKDSSLVERTQGRLSIVVAYWERSEYEPRFDCSIQCSCFNCGICSN
jgi:hypothetical protein